MREFATWYLVVLTVAMASGPLIGFFRARARFGRAANPHAILLLYYYAFAAAMLMMHRWAVNANWMTANRPGFVAVLIVVHATAFAGPLVGALIVALAARSAQQVIDDDETGATGDAPDPGEQDILQDGETHTADQRASRLTVFRLEAWPRVRWVWLVCLLSYVVDMGCHERYTGRYCPSCARAQYECHWGWGITFWGLTVIPYLPKTHDAWTNESVLTPHFDPQGNCTHTWTELGQDVVGVSYGQLQMRPDPTLPMNTPDQQARFGALLAADPGWLDRCRQDLAQGRACAQLVETLYSMLPQWEWPVLDHAAEESVGLGPLNSNGMRITPVGTTGEWMIIEERWQYGIGRP
jgi:hypothetical protein